MRYKCEDRLKKSNSNNIQLFKTYTLYSAYANGPPFASHNPTQYDLGISQLKIKLNFLQTVVIKIKKIKYTF